MNVRTPGLIVLAALAGAAACKDNPTAAGSGTPAQVIANFASLSLAGIGATGSFVAEIVDSRLTPLGGTITFTSCNAATATVAIDPTYQPVPNTSVRAIVTSTGLNKTCIIASAGGIKPDTVQVTVLPTSFPGVLSVANPQPSTLVTLKTGAPALKFDTATVQVLFGTEKVPAVLVVKTADSLVLAVPQFTSDSLRVQGVEITYSGSIVALSSPNKITSGADIYAGDSAWNTAFDLSSMLPGSGSSVTIYPAQLLKNNAEHCPEAVAFGTPGPCLIFKFTLAAPTTLNFSAGWPAPNGNNPDVDIYACSDSVSANWNVFSGGTCPEDGGAGATVADPESTGNFTYPAGTHWFVFDYSAVCDGSSCPGNGVISNFTFTISKP